MQTKPKISTEAWMDMLCASLTDASIVTPHGDFLPGFPSEELQRNTTSLSGEQALRQAHSFYADISDVLNGSDRSILPNWNILDFGSCWGRISRFFLRDISLGNLHGIDVDQGFVNTCRSLFKSDNFAVCSPLPPCDFANSSMNLIAAYSVFSHLSEVAFKAWMFEFHRILKSDGVVAFTTRNESFFDYCANLQSRVGSLTGYSKALANMIPNIQEAKQKYLSGEFVFVTSQGVSGGGAMNEKFYGEAFVPKAYIERNAGELFEILDYKASGKAYDQALFILKKRSN